MGPFSESEPGPDARGLEDLLASSRFSLFSRFGLQSLARVNRGEVSKPNFRFEIELEGEKNRGKKGNANCKTPFFITAAISGVV